jgi:N-alpha-acetyltransferase 38, NatC auxiliary subunit
MDNHQAEQYLQSFLGKTLRIHTTDTRMFVGCFKCTDAVCLFPSVNSFFFVHDCAASTRFNDLLLYNFFLFWISPLLTMTQERNIILSGTFEYRFPSPSAVREAASNVITKSENPSSTHNKVKVDMTSRFIGLIVVPGQHITRIEVEESRHTLRPTRDVVIEA